MSLPWKDILKGALSLGVVPLAKWLAGKSQKSRHAKLVGHVADVLDDLVDDPRLKEALEQFVKRKIEPAVKQKVREEFEANLAALKDAESKLAAQAKAARDRGRK